MTKFKAHLHGVKIDKDGEATISIKAPQSEIEQILALSLLSNTVFNVEITPDVE